MRLQKETNEDFDDIMYHNWGKANTSQESERLDYHLLVYHCLDVAAVGNVLLKNDRLLLKKFMDLTSFDEKTTIPLLTFFLSIHDIGKFSERFQNLQPELMKSLRGYDNNKEYTVRHDSMGYVLWQQSLWKDVFDNGQLGLDSQNYDISDWVLVIKPLILAVTGHHGKPPKTDRCDRMELFSEEDTDMARSFVDKVSSFFLDPDFEFPLSCNETTVDPIDDLIASMESSSWLLAGLVVLSDWIGSDSNYFKYLPNPMPLEKYWDKYALPSAESAVKDCGILPSGISQNTGMEALFPEIGIPSPLQSHVSTCQIYPTPQLFILEDATGSGKTEAALTLAHRIMTKGLASGTFVALPTMATSNAMYERMVVAYQKLFDKGSNASLVLAHSGRYFSDGFRHSIGLNDSHEKEIYNNSSEEDPDESISAQCNRWIADNRKKALLADVGVGTVDQALMSVLPSNHQSLRLLGLARNVLIVDEIHSYDPYMHILLCNLLQFHAALGGNAILLSATIPLTLRQELANSFCKGLDVKCSNLSRTDFPLVTHVAQNDVSENPLASRDGTRRKIEVEFFDDVSRVEDKIINVSKDGRCVCWVRNTVDDAIEGYENLVSRIGENKVILFHARFAMGDRVSIEENVLDIFGKGSDYSKRDGTVLVATQVVEQSLDLDFDYMVSDLAPMDLLIQRAGRLQRHSEHGERGTPVLGIFAPELTDDPSENWYSDTFSKAAYVYPNHGQLWLTTKLLSENGIFIIPDDARYLIEGVFGENARENVPVKLRCIEDKAEGSKMAEKSIAHLNRLTFSGGYKRSVTHWLDDTITPTRLGELTTNVRLAKWDGENLAPWVEANRFAWELSQVSISQKKISSASEYDSDLKSAIEKSMELMKDKGKWCVLIPLSSTDGIEWQGSAKNEREDTVNVIYNAKTGLIINNDKEK